MEGFTSCIAEKILELDSSKESDKVFRDGILRLLKEDSSYRRYLTNLIMGKFVKDETCYYWKVPDLENEFKPLSNSQLKKKLQSCNVQSLFELDLYNLAIVKKKFQEWRAHYDVMGPYFALRKLGISAKHASDITYLHYLKVLKPYRSVSENGKKVTYKEMHGKELDMTNRAGYRIHFLIYIFPYYTENASEMLLMEKKVEMWWLPEYEREGIMNSEQNKAIFLETTKVLQLSRWFLGWEENGITSSEYEPMKIAEKHVNGDTVIEILLNNEVLVRIYKKKNGEYWFKNMHTQKFRIPTLSERLGSEILLQIAPSLCHYLPSANFFWCKNVEEKLHSEKAEKKIIENPRVNFIISCLFAVLCITFLLVVVLLFYNLYSVRKQPRRHNKRN